MTSASMESVLASCPEARAWWRTRDGQTTLTGTPAPRQAETSGLSYPPVASQTAWQPGGREARRRARPFAVLGKEAAFPPEGRKRSSLDLLTSMPAWQVGCGFHRCHGFLLGLRAHRLMQLFELPVKWGRPRALQSGLAGPSAVAVTGPGPSCGGRRRMGNPRLATGERDKIASSQQPSAARIAALRAVDGACSMRGVAGAFCECPELPEKAPAARVIRFRKLFYFIAKQLVFYTS